MPVIFNYLDTKKNPDTKNIQLLDTKFTVSDLKKKTYFYNIRQMAYKIRLFEI